MSFICCKSHEYSVSHRDKSRGGEDEGVHPPTGFYKCSSVTDFSAYSERLCTKLQAKLTVNYEKVFSFQGLYPAIFPTRATAPWTPLGAPTQTPIISATDNW